jgi:hypothetical protein
MTFRARVSHGRLVFDQPIDLPEGTVLDLVVDDEGDDLGEDERAALHARLHESVAQAEAQNLRPAAQILSELRGKR